MGDVARCGRTDAGHRAYGHLEVYRAALRSPHDCHPRTGTSTAAGWLLRPCCCWILLAWCAVQFTQDGQCGHGCDAQHQLELTAPNIHYIPAPALAAVGKVKFEDDVFLPTDEPRGLIKLVLSQAIPAKL